jgi:arabinofuranan 3-O-arabinosyltransferase
VVAVRVENTPNYYSKTPIAMPLGIAEVGIPGLHAASLPATIPTSCRSDLVTVDGAPLWVSVAGATSTALARQSLTISLCGPDAGGLTLGPGTHTLRSATGQTTGFDIDQLALDSAPGGNAMPLASPTLLAAAPVSPSPAVHVVSQTATTMHLSIHGLATSSHPSPVDLILGESINAGWKATVVGGGSLGRPVLLDGFANGWRLDPSTLGSAVQDGTVSVVLQWAPQTRVDVALLISIVAILGCAVLALVPVGRRRRRRHRHPEAAHRGPVPPGAPVAAVDPGDGPFLLVPFGRGTRPVPVWTSLATGVAVGLVAGLIASPLAGSAAGIATVVALLIPRLRIVLGLVAIAAVVAAGAFVAIYQARHQVPADGAWPLSFNTASQLAWAGVAFLGADAVVDVVLRRRAVEDAGTDEPAGGTPD